MKENNKNIMSVFLKELLEYPLDREYIFRKKNKIKNELLKKSNLKDIKIAILGGSTTSELKIMIEIFFINIGIRPVFYESDYNKYYEESVFDNNNLKKFSPEIIYLHTSIVNIEKFPDINSSSENVEDLLKNEINKYKSIWQSLLNKYNATIIQNNFELPFNRSLGNLDATILNGKTSFINKLNIEVSKEINSKKNIYLNDINYLSAFIGLDNWHDKKLWCIAKYAMSMDGIIEIGFNLSKIVSSIVGKSKKCLVLDLDNTCWGGVIGDDGVCNIAIGNENAYSESFQLFQIYIKELHKRGVTLAVCSKNDLKNAKEGFTHPSSILKLDDFTSFKANWDTKDLNIIDISKEINIALDSLVFIDDNNAEREFVKSQLPHVSVPNVGSDVIQFIDYIDRNGYFEPISLSDDDISRNKYYKDNKKRFKEESNFKSYDEFLISLKMTAEIEKFKPIYLDRIAQLTNKTNQFNLTTKRYTIGEIENIASNSKYIQIYGKLFDKYGDNGLIAVTIGSIKNNECHLDLWLMSCRVLKRDMEFAMLDEVVRLCKEKGISEITGYYYKSAKNSMVSDLYDKFGFTLIKTNNEDTVWKLDISNYENKNKYISKI